MSSLPKPNRAHHSLVSSTFNGETATLTFNLAGLASLVSGALLALVFSSTNTSTPWRNRALPRRMFLCALAGYGAYSLVADSIHVVDVWKTVVKKGRQIVTEARARKETPAGDGSPLGDVTE